MITYVCVNKWEVYMYESLRCTVLLASLHSGTKDPRDVGPLLMTFGLFSRVPGTKLQVATTPAVAWSLAWIVWKSALDEICNRYL